MKETAEELRANILSSAIALFIEKGVEKVTTRELTERVGISRSHIYHYFRDWQTLCLEALTVYMQADLDNLKARVAGLPAREQLRLLINNYLPEVQDAVWQLYGSLWQLAVHNEDYAALARLMVDRWQQLMADIIAAGIDEGMFSSRDPARITRQLGAIVNGYSDLLIVEPSASARQQAMEDIDAFIAQVLLTPPAAASR
ncbi:TetR/AcrR family transcriptional regulator [Erwinia sp. JUb26]|uniref:TetR/AcrR family transcriptional regulator n=1 Tax=Erwinia sp. JUb26 TaxID=2485126 RepID=UPI000F47BBE1|nr:TetR/AcrR family transcriptional regulator [Erwinia sp. JUb26]ROR08690.1 TetR family transcriptional regulator [Erwinia sp. JUb26]